MDPLHGLRARPIVAAVLPFWISIGALSLFQGLLVALPATLPQGWLPPVRGRAWALVPPLSVAAFVIVAGAAERASAQGLSWLALVAVPPLAAVALGALTRPARPLFALAVPVLFAIAWVDRTGVAGRAAAVLLSGLSCVTLGVLLAAVTPPRWLGAGILAMAAVDTAAVISDQLQRPNRALNLAHPAAGLPRLQSAAFGSAVMGYGDLFVAAVLGALLASWAGRRWQLFGAAATAAAAVCFDLLFTWVSELPATVPAAAALLLTAAARARSSARSPAPDPRPPARAAPARSARAP